MPASSALPVPAGTATASGDDRDLAGPSEAIDEAAHATLARAPGGLSSAALANARGDRVFPRGVSPGILGVRIPILPTRRADGAWIRAAPCARAPSFGRRDGARVPGAGRAADRAAAETVGAAG